MSNNFFEFSEAELQDYSLQAAREIVQRASDFITLPNAQVVMNIAAIILKYHITEK